MIDETFKYPIIKARSKDQVDSRTWLNHYNKDNGLKLLMVIINLFHIQNL